MSLTGCLSEETECTENCWKLDSDSLNELLSSPDALDILYLAEVHDELRVATLTEVLSLSLIHI